VRHYDPQPWIHQSDCPDAPAGLFILKAVQLKEAYPYARPHVCFTQDTVRFNREVVAEHIKYEPHPYRASSILLPEAARALCEHCRGTHPDLA
jgi:hypothetical protein